MTGTLTFRLAPHNFLPGAQVIELWCNGQFVGQITASPDHRTLRIISKHGLSAEALPSVPGDTVAMLQVKVLGG